MVALWLYSLSLETIASDLEMTYNCNDYLLVNGGSIYPVTSDYYNVKLFCNGSCSVAKLIYLTSKSSSPFSFVYSFLSSSF